MNGSFVSFLAETTSSASDSLLNGNVITIIVTSIVVPLALAIMNKYGLKPPGQVVVPPSEEATKTIEPSLVASASREDLLSMVPEMWKRLKDLEDREDQWQREREEIISQNKMLMRTNDILGRGLHTFFQWVDEGAKPPSPEVSEDVKDIVRLIVERVEQDKTETGT